jgi:predicted nucleotidyltransferase
MLDLIERNRDRIAALCRRHGVRRLDLFGSAARGGDFDPATSDVDFLYEFDPADRSNIADRFFALLDDLEATLGRPVDLVSAKDVINPCFLEVANRHRLNLYAA